MRLKVDVDHYYHARPVFDDSCSAAAETALIFHDVMRRLDKISISTAKRTEEPSRRLVRKSSVRSTPLNKILDLENVALWPMSLGIYMDGRLEHIPFLLLDGMIRLRMRHSRVPLI